METKSMKNPSDDKCCLKESVLGSNAKLSENEKMYIKSRLDNPDWKSETDFLPWFPGGFTVDIIDSSGCTIDGKPCYDSENMISGPSGTTWRTLFGTILALYSNEEIANELWNDDPLYWVVQFHN